MSQIKPALTIDVRGQMCPMPVLKTREAIQRVNIGEIVEVIATDPASKPDIESWARKTGNKIIHIETSETSPVIFRFFIQKVK